MRSVGIWIELGRGQFHAREGILRILLQAVRHRPAGVAITFFCRRGVAAEIEPLLQEHAGERGASPIRVRESRPTDGSTWRSTIAARVGFVSDRLRASTRRPDGTQALAWHLRSFLKSGQIGHLLRAGVAAVAGVLRFPFQAIARALRRTGMPSEVADMRGLVGRSGIDLLVVPNPAWDGWIGVAVPVTVMAWDMFFDEYPSWDDILPARETFARSFAAASRVITMSEHTTRMIEKGDYPVAGDRIEALPPPVFDRGPPVDPEAVDDFFRSAYRTSMHPCMAGLDLAATKYLLCATQARKNKNLWTLLRAYRDLVRRDRLPHKLFLTTDLPAEIAEWLHKEGLSIDVLAWRSVPEGVLGEMFRHAEAVVVPSLFEGGIPLNLLEANARGVPVALAAMPTVTALRGFDSQAAYSFYPSDEAGMRRAIHACLADPQAVVEHQRQLLAANPVVRDWPTYAADIFAAPACAAGPRA